MREILKKIKSCQNGMNTSEFARFLGLNQQTVYYYLAGERKISLEFVYTICEKCHVSADWLLDLPGGVAPAVAAQSAASTDGKVAELERENAMLRGRIEGLEFALSALGKEARRAPASTRLGHTA